MHASGNHNIKNSGVSSSSGRKASSPNSYFLANNSDKMPIKNFISHGQQNFDTDDKRFVSSS
jgi:hypothetical protein